MPETQRRMSEQKVAPNAPDFCGLADAVVPPEGGLGGNAE